MNTTPAKSSRFTFAALLALCVGALALSACNTMEGAGEDIERAGENLQDAAEKNR